MPSSWLSRQIPKPSILFLVVWCSSLVVHSHLSITEIKWTVFCFCVLWSLLGLIVVAGFCLECIYSPRPIVNRTMILSWTSGWLFNHLRAAWQVAKCAGMFDSSSYVFYLAPYLYQLTWYNVSLGPSLRPANLSMPYFKFFLCRGRWCG